MRSPARSRGRRFPNLSFSLAAFFFISLIDQFSLAPPKCLLSPHLDECWKASVWRRRFWHVLYGTIYTLRYNTFPTTWPLSGRVLLLQDCRKDSPSCCELHYLIRRRLPTAQPARNQSRAEFRSTGSSFGKCLNKHQGMEKKCMSGA
jgi:hypothetical protein